MKGIQIMYEYNEHGIRVMKCCRSCAHKDLTRALSLRSCGKLHKDVGPTEVCQHWAMSEQLKRAGRSQGRVKRKEYLMWLAAERDKEKLVSQMGQKVAGKSIAQIRAEFEQEHGSIYLDF